MLMIEPARALPARSQYERRLRVERLGRGEFSVPDNAADRDSPADVGAGRQGFVQLPEDITARAITKRSAAHSAAATKALSQYQAVLDERSEPQPALLAYQIMSRNVLTIGSAASLHTVRKLFVDNAFQALPVLDDYGQYQGLLTRLRFYEYLLAEGVTVVTLGRTVLTSFADERGEIAGSSITVGPTLELRRVAKLLFEQKLSAIPVVGSEQRLLGIVSRSDILRCAGVEPALSLWC